MGSIPSTTNNNNINNNNNKTPKSHYCPSNSSTSTKIEATLQNKIWWELLLYPAALQVIYPVHRKGCLPARGWRITTEGAQSSPPKHLWFMEGSHSSASAVECSKCVTWRFIQAVHRSLEKAPSQPWKLGFLKNGNLLWDPREQNGVRSKGSYS
jgi:hypothetical protein